MLLVLFDVDGTLILTHGAIMRALHRAMNHHFGVPADQAPIQPDGKTDPLILRELLEYFHLEDRWSEATRDLVLSSYLRYLDEEMSEVRDRGLIRILPGVRTFLDMLSAQPDFCIGLVTGNLEEGAGIKLKNAGLDRYFRFGSYGSDSEDRTALTRIGIRRGAQIIAPAPVDGAFVIGDTPLDIRHGHAAGARVVAVASARYGMEELRAHDPDLLVPDLNDAVSLIRFMRGPQPRESHPVWDVSETEFV
ncbi:MAG: HAD hydrolase-like protein [Acidobacteria bacterium]|nr:HAD hydrolase-like protein [Acidobacteriota bacterium]